MMSLQLNKFVGTIMSIISPNKKFVNEMSELTDKLEKETEEINILHNNLSIEFDKLVNTFDLLPAVVFIKDKENKITHANKKFFNTLGFDESIMNIPLHEIDGNKDNAEKYYKNDIDVMISGEPKLDIVENFTLEDGTVKKFKTDKIPLIIDGEIVGVVGFSIDIDEMCSLLRIKGIC